MKVKRIVWILLVVLLIAAVAFTGTACKKKNGGTDNNNTQQENTDNQNPEDKDPTDPNPSDPNPSDPNPSDPNPSDPEPSGTVQSPTGITVGTDGKVTWSRVSNAGKYEVEINGKTVEVTFANVDLLQKADPLPADGKFTVKIRTVDKEGGKSNWTEEVTYNHQGQTIVTPQVSGVENGVLKWSGSSASYAGIPAPYPVVTVEGTENKLAVGTTSYDLSAVAGKSSVTLHYVGDGVYYKNSARVSYVYNGSTKKLAFAAPASAYMDAGVLRFEQVEGANIYYFKDVYNTVTYLSGSDINSLSSDRDKHFLIKEVWAGNTDSDIENSEAVSVTYFTEEQGKGTEAEPFLISEMPHLRFIEYYESIGEAKYYRLTNDIVFEDYTPKKDEDYSNFYNLGSFSGVLDGNGHTVSNIVVYYKDGYSSIFDTITESGVIRNLKIANTKWRTWTNRTNDGIMHEKGGECAILAYTNKGLIENVILQSGFVTAVKDGAAGLVSINRGTIRNCEATSEFAIAGAYEAGAFAIYNAGTISRCINNAPVSGKLSVGGIAGRNAGLITECSDKAKISGDSCIGGIVGYNYNVKDVNGMQYETMVSYCSNYGEVYALSYGGGIAGRNGSDGYNEVAADSYANAGIYGCYNRAKVSGYISIGGIVGRNYGYYVDENDAGFGVRACYNSGTIDNQVEGLESGRIYLSVANCKWAEDGAPDIYVYYWKNTGSGDQSPAAWPGVKMEKVAVGETSFYSVKLPSGYSTNQLAGLKFCRVNPDNNSDVYNASSENITAISSTDIAIYYVKSDWTSGASLDNACWGAIAGANNYVNDCYFVANSKLGATNTTLSATASGNTPGTNGISTEQMRQVYTTLNTVLGKEAFVAVENKYPVLKWETEQ